MGLSRQLVIFGIVIGGYQLIQSRSRGKDLEEYYNLKYGAESAGQKVRNRLQGADVGPQDEMLEDPSIYRDWAMVQKGYQSLRMMNDNDNFNSEDSFSSEWHYFSECETKGCDGDIEYRDVYACPSCGQDDVEILLGDTCPDCGETAEDVSKYAIFYCSDCEEDYTDMYNSESFSAHVYRGKPMSELGYAGRAMATQKMIKAADIEQSILQLEAAIKVGLISEDEIMDQLRKKFSE
jgi:ribosomal protein L37AE/L43A